MNIALFPLPIIWGDKGRNLQAVADLLPTLHPDTDILVLPETFSTGFPVKGANKEQVRLLAERNTGETIDYLKQLSRLYGIAICGSFIADTGGSLYNRAFFIEPSGDETFYDKRHLFTMAGEDKIFSRGYSRPVLRYRGWNISMIVCYDLRFPCWSRNRDNEYDLLICVANWPQVRVNAWNALLTARAIENQAYVVGVDCLGEDPAGFVYDGSSRVIDYKGHDIATPSPDGKYLTATLSLPRLEAFREKFPAWRDAD